MCEDVLMGVPVLGARTWHTPQGSSSHRNAGGTAPYAAAAAISAEALKPDATVNCMLLCPAQNHTSPYSTSTIVMGFVPAVELVAVMVAGFSDLFLKEVFVKCVCARARACVCGYAKHIIVSLKKHTSFQQIQAK